MRLNGQEEEDVPEGSNREALPNSQALFAFSADVLEQVREVVHHSWKN